MFWMTALAESRHCGTDSQFDGKALLMSETDLGEEHLDAVIAGLDAPVVRLLEPEREHDQARVVDEAEMTVSIEMKSQTSITHKGNNKHRNSELESTPKASAWPRGRQFRTHLSGQTPRGRSSPTPRGTW